MRRISIRIGRITLAGIAFIALAGCSSNHSAPSSLASSTDSSAPPFAQLREGWAADLRAKRISESVDRYTDDADFLQPDGTRVHGTVALKTLYEQITMQFDSDLHFTSRTTEFANGLAYDSGSYNETLTTRANGKQLNAAGDYLTVYRRSPDGHWRIAAQAWTSAK